MNIVEKLKKQDDLITGNKTTKSVIENAELDLGVRFADEFRAILEAFGFVMLGSHRLLGITKIEANHVVFVTKEHRKSNAVIPEDYYVIEELDIDGITIWQSPDGDIFEVIPNTKPRKIANSIVDYLCI